MLTLLDFVESPEARDAPYKTRLEIDKLPRRLGFEEVEDLVDYPADLKTFEDRIVPSGEPLFAKAKVPRAARAQANSRIRTALKAFLAAQRPAAPAAPETGSAYTTVAGWVRDNEGFTAKGDRFPQGRSAAIVMLRSYLGSVALSDLTAADVAAGRRHVPSRKRRSFDSAVAFVDRLSREADSLPTEVAACLPAAPVRCAGSDRPTCWPDLPEGLRLEAEAAFDRALASTEAELESAMARLEAGEDPETVVAEVNALRSRDVTNPSRWREGQRGTVSWLYRGTMRLGHRPETLSDLLTTEVFGAAIAAHGDRVAAGELRPLSKTQTLKTRFTAAIQLAATGLGDRGRATALQLLRQRHVKEVRNPHVGGFSERTDALIDDLHDGGDALYGRIVRAPDLIAEAARTELDAWEDLPASKRLAALKLGAAAAIWALQLSRPRRRANIVHERLRAARDPDTRIALHARTLHVEGEEYVSLTPRGEVKNLERIEFVVRGADAEILRWWIEELRPRYIETRGIADSCYLFPGSAVPRNQRAGLDLPAGCVSGAWFAETWTAGAGIVGLAMTPHEARHAGAVIWLAHNPGDFGGAAALIGSSERTVREKYGADDGATIAARARAESRERYA